MKWSAEGVKEGDLVFLGGNPGPTGRLSTASQLTFLRDTALPLRLTRLQPRVLQLNAFAASSEDNLRAAQSTLSLLLTEYKSDAGKLIGLRDDRMVTRKTAFEGKIRRAVEGNAKLGAEAGKVWDEITAAYRKWKPLDKPYEILEGSAAPGSRLFRMARQIVRAEPLDDSGDPVNETIETMMLTQYLTELVGLGLGDKELPLKSILAGATPAQAAEKMVKASKLKDAAARNSLAANRDAALKSDDPVIALAQAIDAPALRLRKQHDDIIGTLEVSATEKIAQFRLKLFGAADYPDGTGTPRVEFGVVKGYTDRAGVPQPYAATFSGLYYRKDNEGPWLVPPALDRCPREPESGDPAQLREHRRYRRRRLRQRHGESARRTRRRHLRRQSGEPSRDLPLQRRTGPRRPRRCPRHRRCSRSRLQSGRLTQRVRRGFAPIPAVSARRIDPHRFPRGQVARE